MQSTRRRCSCSRKSTTLYNYTITVDVLLLTNYMFNALAVLDRLQNQFVSMNVFTGRNHPPIFIKPAIK